MHWLDIVLIAVLVLFALIGLSKGFMVSFLSLINTLVSFVAALFLAKPLASFLNSATTIGSKLSGLIGGKLAGIEGFGTVLEAATPAGDFIANSGGVTGFFKWLLPKVVGDGVIEAGTTPAAYFGGVLGAICLFIICGIIIFILIRILIALLSRLFKRLRTNSVIGGIDRVFGFVLGAVKGAVIIGIIFFVLNFIPVVNSWFQETIANTTVVREFANAVEEVTKWITQNVDFNKLLAGLIPKIN